MKAAAGLGIQAIAMVGWTIVGLVVFVVIGASIQGGMSDADQNRGPVALLALGIGIAVAIVGGYFTVRRLRGSPSSAAVPPAVDRPADAIPVDHGSSTIIHPAVAIPESLMQGASTPGFAAIPRDAMPNPKEASAASSSGVGRSLRTIARGVAIAISVVSLPIAALFVGIGEPDHPYRWLFGLWVLPSLAAGLLMAIAGRGVSGAVQALTGPILLVGIIVIGGGGSLSGPPDSNPVTPLEFGGFVVAAFFASAIPVEIGYIAARSAVWLVARWKARPA